MWLVCKTLHKLPTDPAFRDLSPLQLMWIVENIKADTVEQEKLFTQINKPNTTTTELDDQSFDDFVKKIKTEATSGPHRS